jgi:hypothetical protein
VRDPVVTKVRRAVGAVAVTLAVTVVAGCSDANQTASNDAEDIGPPSTQEAMQAAEQALVALGRPASARFDASSFDFSDPIKGVGSGEEDRLASMSWDVYYVLDNGAVGAWGAGMDVFGSAGAAEVSAVKQATFWICEGPRTALDTIARGTYDYLDASTCKRPGEETGYYATLSAADGVVTANLTVGAQDREVAASALVAVWASLSDSTQAVVGEVG